MKIISTYHPIVIKLQYIASKKKNSFLFRLGKPYNKCKMESVYRERISTIANRVKRMYDLIGMRQEKIDGIWQVINDSDEADIFQQQYSETHTYHQQLNKLYNQITQYKEIIESLNEKHYHYLRLLSEDRRIWQRFDQ